MNKVTCPHCGAGNEAGVSFCVACGKAMPTAGSGPRLLDAGDLASTTAGQTVQAEELQKKAKSAATALLAVGILQAIFATVIVGMASGNPEVNVGMVATVLYGIAAVFLGLFFWARVNPLPAAIVGLLVFVTLHLLDAIADPSALARGIVVKIIVIVVLVKAIQAGAQHRQLLREIEAGGTRRTVGTGTPGPDR